MKKLNENELAGLEGGICQSFPGNADPGGCFPRPCWAGAAIGIVFGPGTNPNQDLACPF